MADINNLKLCHKPQTVGDSRSTVAATNSQTVHGMAFKKNDVTFLSRACIYGEGQVANRLLHINLTTDNKFSTLPMMPSLEGAIRNVQKKAQAEPMLQQVTVPVNLDMRCSEHNLPTTLILLSATRRTSRST